MKYAVHAVICFLGLLGFLSCCLLNYNVGQQIKAIELEETPTPQQIDIKSLDVVSKSKVYFEKWK